MNTIASSHSKCCIPKYVVRVVGTSSFVKSPFAPSLCHQDMYVKRPEIGSQSSNTMTMLPLGCHFPETLQAAMIV
ncbi:hypothetical protein HBH56_183450 [Parastagonospora nodorum]|uniref:Uncharacterized protein n=1 Tax=Phaeosphaeria nodorum (strain SN15 / ATCC MYA-4574 / FGSC 10173) TaxID=321614 RepID=A0A7U2FJF7_PHANO|nr:hypothetical protein HBH56_183450 [Parastagonospora nodorum]QRD04136.1 hypothetical protein JI435_420760 [Parastagonospora nodorum SN15]KAH3925973.1 hypothetical protein HBH54_172600 [Parastagonospora nodorum]KAH3962438.1 hypothetical protein HBH52_224100 [Parastagonospora nodorum]KAH3964862.1 hypothetical protein HBH51_155100 [Parastagonospora nodorum]